MTLRIKGLAVLAGLLATSVAWAQDAMFVDSTGNVGVGTNTPSAPFEVSRTNGSAQVLVSDSGSASPLQMFKLNNNGFPAFNMTDSSQSDFSWTFRLSGQSGVDERFTITKLGTGAAEMELKANGDMSIRGTLSTGSSRTIKDNIVPVDGDTVLAKLDALKVDEWSYKTARNQRHVGPMAEDFYATFGLGPDNKHVAPGDMAGVALAAAKALKAENERLREQNEEILDRLSRLEAQLDYSKDQ